MNAYHAKRKKSIENNAFAYPQLSDRFGAFAQARLSLRTGPFLFCFKFLNVLNDFRKNH